MKRLFLGYFLFMVVMMPNNIPAGPNAAALISSITGKANILKAGQTDKIKAQLGDQLFHDDLIVTREMSRLREKNPGDKTPSFVLVNYFMEKRLFHDALSELEYLEEKSPEDPFVLRSKMEIFAELGLWKNWEEVRKRL